MDKMILAPSAGRLGIEQFGDPSLTHFATELSSDKAALRQSLDSLDGAARVSGSRYLEEAILGVRGAFQAFGRPDAQKVLVLLAGGPPEDAPFEKAWVLKEQLNCTVLVVFPLPGSSSAAGTCNGRDKGCRNLQSGDGDCDKDSDCAAGLKCGKNNCMDFRDSEGWPKSSRNSWDLTDDCCYRPSDASYDNIASSPALGKYIKLEQSFGDAADKVEEYIPLLQACSDAEVEIAARVVTPATSPAPPTTTNPIARTPTTSPPDTPSGGDDNSPTQSPTPDIIVQSSFPGGGPSDPAKTSPAPATQSPTPEVIVQSSFPGGGPSDPTATSEPTEQPMVGIFGYAEPTPDPTPPPTPEPAPEPAGRNFPGPPHAKGRPEPCCGSQGHLVEEADLHSCAKIGASDLSALIHNRDASETFGDNVAVDRYEYFLEVCSHAAEAPTDCSYTKITDPDIDGHVFKVGVSNIKIRAVDFDENHYECMRTIYVYDKQKPYFTDPNFVPMHPHNEPDQINVNVPAESCVVQNEAGFIRHADLGFQTSAADNCDVAGRSQFGLRASDPGGVHLRKLIYAYDPDVGLDTSKADLLYDSDDSSNSPNSTSAGLVPGIYQMKYMLIDDFSEPFNFPPDEDLPEWHQFNHSVLLKVTDATPPTSIDKCPDNIYIEIEPWEMSAVVNWTVPKVNQDNCLAVLSLPPPQPKEFEDKYPGMDMDVGAHIVKYSFKDAHGNPYHEECIFEVRIVHKNKPINVTCPSLEPFDTEANSDFGIVSWPAPVVMQDGKVLDSPHITYEPHVAPGMPFPYGETTIKVIATGQNYTAVKEGHQEIETDECYFKVQVGDPQDPKCDGREYRCAAPGSGVKPYGLCDGPELVVAVHENFEATTEYETTGVRKLAEKVCCTSELEVAHECADIPGTGSKQCKPVSR